LQVAHYFSTIIKLYFVSFVQFSCVCLDVVFIICYFKATVIGLLYSRTKSAIYLLYIVLCILFWNGCYQSTCYSYNSCQQSSCRPPLLLQRYSNCKKFDVFASYGI